ncbi:tryptophan-rich sensory protein, partial [Kineococcus glutinatus]|uniref:tryptophan-rich sensory protein n=1 Tax=Kineococcus glutinatus TaxID=1070872 RepID=UPI0031ECEB57
MSSLAHSPATVSGTHDRTRQAVVAATAVVAVVGSTIGSGAFGGTPIAEAAGGALSASATLVAPAGPAFAIWSVIYTGLIALAVWQLLPAHREDARQRRTGWWTAASLLLNAAWIGTVQAGWVTASVAVIAALLLVLVVVVGRLGASRPTGRVEALVVDGSLGLYLGWVSIATVANTAAALSAAGAAGNGSWLGLTEPVWAVLVLAVAAGIGVAVAALTRGRLAFGAGLAWGLAWVAVASSSGPDTSAAAAVVAEVAG